MGSEMCIRDRILSDMAKFSTDLDSAFSALSDPTRRAIISRLCDGCLLYTSDAADERSSVDLGGRRIIKKKKSDK